MSITYRGNKFKALTHEELDENFRDLRYDTDLHRVTNSGNTTNVSITVESITANTITTTNTIIQELSLLATDELIFADVDPNYLKKSIEISENVKIVGQEGSIYAPGNIIQVKQKIYDKPSRYYFDPTSTYSSDFLGWDKSKSYPYSEVFNDGVLSFTPHSTDSNNTVQVNLCLSYSLDSKKTSYSGEIDIELWDYPDYVSGTYKFITHLATIKSGTISTDPNNVCGNTLQSLNLVYLDENISNTRNYVIRFKPPTSFSPNTTFLNINQTTQMYYASNTFVETSNVAVTTRTWEPYVESIVGDEELITNFNDGNNQLDVANTESTTWAFERGTANTQRFGPNYYTPDFGEYVINGHPGTKFDVIMYDDFNEPTINTIKWNSSSTINLVSANTGVSATGNTEGLRVPDIKATNEIVLSVNDYSDGQNLISQSSTDWDIANCNSEIFVCELDDVNLAFSRKLYPPMQFLPGYTDTSIPAGYNQEEECLAYVNNRWTFPKNPKSSNNAIVFPGGWDNRLDRKIELYSKFLDLTNYTHISFYMIRGTAGNGYYRTRYSGGVTPYMQLDFRTANKSSLGSPEPFTGSTGIYTSRDEKSLSISSSNYGLQYLNQNNMFEWEKYHLEIPAAARVNNMRIHFAFYYNDFWFAIQDLTVYNEANLDSSSCYYLKTDENNYGTCVLESNNIDLSNTYGLTYYFAYGTDTNGGRELNNRGCSVINSETIYDDFETGTLNSSLWDTANSEGFFVASSGTGTGTGGFISPYGNYYLNTTVCPTGRNYRLLISKPLDLTSYTHFGYTSIKGNNTNGGTTTTFTHYATLLDERLDGHYRGSGYTYSNFTQAGVCTTGESSSIDTSYTIDDHLFRQPIGDESEYDGNILEADKTVVWGKSLYLIPESWRKSNVVLIIEVYDGNNDDGYYAFDNIFFTNDVTPSANIQIEIVNDNETWNSSNINLSTWLPFYSHFENDPTYGTNPNYVIPRLRQTTYNWTQERLYIPPNYRKENSKLRIKVHNATGDIGLKDLRFYQFEKSNSNYYLPFYNQNIFYDPQPPSSEGYAAYVVEIPKILTKSFFSPNLSKIKFDVFTGGVGGRQSNQMDNYSYIIRATDNQRSSRYIYSQWKTTPNTPPMENWFSSRHSNFMYDSKINYYNGLSPSDTYLTGTSFYLNVKIHYSMTGNDGDWFVHDIGSKEIVRGDNPQYGYYANYKRLATSLGQQIEIEIPGDAAQSNYKKLEMWITASYDYSSYATYEGKRITTLSYEGDPESQTDPDIAHKFLPRATVAITKVVGFDGNIMNQPIDITEYVVEGYTVFNDTNQSNPQSSLTAFEIVKD